MRWDELSTISLQACSLGLLFGLLGVGLAA